MNKFEFTLTPNDINTIFESLCESNDVDVADSVLTDVFMVLSKLETNVVMKPENDCDCGLSGVSNTITNIINDIGDALDDLDEPMSEEECWNVNDNNNEYWEVS